MKLTLLALFAFQFHFVRAQESTPSFRVINDSIVSRFNRGDFKSIYLLGSNEFKINENENGFINFLSHLKKETGNITAISLGDCGERKAYKWIGEKKNLRVEWAMKKFNEFDDYFINDLIEQPYTKNLLTDNKLQSKVDTLVNKYVSYYMLDANSIGLSIGIIKDGKMYKYNYGEVKKGTKQLPTANSFYELGSISKTFIATLLAQAVLENKVSLEDDIRKYLPGKYPDLEYNGAPVRLLNLANHTSCLPESFREFPYDSLGKLTSDEQFTYFEHYTKGDLFRDLQHLKPDTLPGTRYSYNSNSFHILIVILERIYRKPYEQLLTTYLKTKLTMTNTKNNLSALESNRFVQGYNDRGEEMPHYNNPKTMTGGPGLNSTLNDMLRYVSANLTEKNQAIKLTHKQTWRNKDGSAIGLSWMMNTNCKDDRYIYHSGRSRGCNSICSFYPDKKLGFVILVNETVNQGRLFVLERLLIQALD